MIEKILTGQTPNITEENIQKLKSVFPDVFTEDKVDFKKLQQVLGNYIETSNERYNFSWNGKAKALHLSQTQSMGTLRPCKEESKDWDTTQNLYFEGDNLEVLKLLQKSYHSKVKMIYIDPPYNTGNDFVYPDNFTDSIENYKAITGQIDVEGKNISSNSETSGRYHTDWLNMMYPRLRLARNLLTDDGVIFISIDDNEVDNLKKVCNEVFVEDNFVARMVWQSTPGSNTGTNIITVTEYILVYAKSKTECKFNTMPISDKEKYIFQDEYVKKRGKYILNKLDRRMTGSHYSEALNYPIKMPDGKMVYPGSTEERNNENWNYRWSKTKVEWGIENGFIVLKKVDGKWNAYFKQYLKVDNNDTPIERSLPYQNLLKLEQFNSTQGTREIIGFLGNKFFDYPKPSQLIKYLINICSVNDLILDFFSGSATTAHAVMQLNAEDGGNRKFICVQLPEPCDESGEAFKAGYKNICEIGKERIRRAGEKIKEEVGLLAQNLDVGFKVLKLDSSNIRKWQPDYENLESSLDDFVDNYIDGRTELDVVYEIMLKYGLDLTYPVDELTIDGKKVYSIGFGMLIICLDNEITTGIANGIIDLVKELAPETTRVVFKDNGFKTDSNKTNIKEILKCGGIEEFITL